MPGGGVFVVQYHLLFLLESETIISQKKDSDVVVSELSDDEYLIFDALQQQSSLKVQDIMSILNKKIFFPIVQKLTKDLFHY
jgi:primosomal protein N' (replication factor Y)